MLDTSPPVFHIFQQLIPHHNSRGMRFYRGFTLMFRGNNWPTQFLIFQNFFMDKDLEETLERLERKLDDLRRQTFGIEETLDNFLSSEFHVYLHDDKQAH